MRDQDLFMHLSSAAPRIALAFLAAALLFACTTNVADLQGDDSTGHLLILDGNGADAEALQAPRLDLRSAEPVHTIAIWVEGLAEGEAAGVAWRPAGGDWEPLELTHAEETLTLWRADSPQAWQEAELRGVQGASFLHVEAHPHRIDRTRPLARELPLAGTVQRFDRLKRLPPEVVTREEWNAREPACERPLHTPERMAVHHTVTGTPDSLSAPARMRGMQNFHIDGREWCDIGYHFVIGHDDRVYQASGDERRRAAHVGGQNDGNIGLSFMGTFTSVQPTAGQFEAMARMLAWIGNTYDIAINRELILGHREHPGASTQCPGTALFPRMDELVTRAAQIAADPDAPIPSEGTSTPVPSDPPVQVSLEVSLDADDAFIPAGRRAGGAQVLPGDRFTWEVRMRNDAAEVLRGNLLGLSYDPEHVALLNWRIESDHPANDGETWVLNSANDEDANPPRNAIPASASFVMHAFSPGETKRLVLEAEALAPVPLEQDAALLRVWLQQIDGVYERADEWSANPALNRIGTRVREERGVQVLSRDWWRFAGVTRTEDNEGWRACSGSGPLVEGAADGGALRLRGDAPLCARSPEWTRIESGLWDELVVRSAAPVDPANLRLRWTAGAGWGSGGVSPDRAVDDALVFAPAGATGWGEVLEGLELFTEGDATDQLDIVSVYLQSSDTQRVNAAGEPFIGDAGQVWPEEPSESDAPEPEESGVEDSSSVDEGAPTPGRTPPVRQPGDEEGFRSVTYRTTESGCAQAGSGGPAGGTVLWLTLLGMAVARSGRREERR